MITPAELDDLRADSIREMPDLITILRFDEDLLDPDTLIATPQYQTIATDLPAFITRSTQGGGSKTGIGDRPLEMDGFAVHTTAAHIDILAGDLILVTQSADPIPLQLNVLAYSAGSASGTRRITCERIGDGLTAPDVVITGGN